VERHPLLASLAARRAGPLLLGVLAGCSGTPATVSPPPPSAPAGIHLEARLTGPLDVSLQWSGTAPQAAGHVVEYANEAQGEYTILEFLPPGRRRFEHVDLIPETPFYYRVRSFFGPASSPVEVALPEPRPGDDRQRDDDGAWARPQTLPAAAHVIGRPIRGAGEATEAAPLDLRAAIVRSRGVKLTWTDRASDEEGYLIEVKPEGGAEFRVAAVVDPDVNAFGLVTLPEETRAAFRVRAFYYGPPSNLAHQTTGPEPRPTR
jgi:hypothetical protein